MQHFLEGAGWQVVAHRLIEGRESQFYSYSNMNLSSATKEYLSRTFTRGIYQHQKAAIENYLSGNHVCLLTGTASGKSMVFYVNAMEELIRDPQARVIAIYPMKALGKEQQEKWEAALVAAGLDANVGRIDGNVKLTTERKSVFKTCRVVIMTPDVIHAWLMSNLAEPAILEFLKKLRLIVVDEVHTYTGVFGSNAAFLFRRLRHALEKCRNFPRFLCASATMANPESHLSNLFGLEFVFIGPDMDTSPKYNVELVFLLPPRIGDFMSETSQFLKKLSQGNHRFITFVDSRKQTELIASILSRGQTAGEEKEDEDFEVGNIHLNNYSVLPFRAGYEEQDREVIQRRLSKNLLKGIISTSALELGMDIPYLDTGVLIGVPYSQTSFWQRIGRIGRHGPGTVYIIHSGGYYDEIVFKNPDSLFQRPLTQGALYLQNPRIQYIHALCLARSGGEHDQICQSIAGSEETEHHFSSTVKWPTGFLELCEAERRGEIPIDLQAMKSEAGEDPNHVYPLRDVESQFHVRLKQGPRQDDKGSLSYSQLMREAYPGAVYYYTAQAFRVYKVNLKAKEVLVRPEKRYTTIPSAPPTLVIPNLTASNVYSARRFGKLFVLETNVQVIESVTGFKEKRGSREALPIKYPLDAVSTSIFFDQQRFSRIYFTTGVIIAHPALATDNTVLEAVAKLVYEAFLITLPFERQDISYAVGKFKTEKPPYIYEDDRYITIFDRTYGSLRLSGNVMREHMLGQVLDQAIQIAELGHLGAGIEGDGIPAEVKEILQELLAATGDKSVTVNIEVPVLPERDQTSLQRVLLPGSIGLVLTNNNKEFHIEKVMFHPRLMCLVYKGSYLLESEDDSLQTFLPVTHVVEVPGESRIGYYDYENGELIEIE